MMNGTTPIHTSATPTKEYYPLPSRTPPPNPSPNATAPNAVYLAEDKLSAMAKLEIPGLPLSESLKDAEKSSALLLNFSVSDNGKHLLLNNELLALLVPDPSRPSLIRAEKVFLEWDIEEIPMPANEKAVDLDYELWSGNRDDPGITYYNYYPKFNLNLLGAGVTDFESQRQNVDQTTTHYLLDSPNQKIIEIVLHDIESRPSNSRNLSYRIESVKLLDRAKDYRAPRPDDRPCSRWSWRCADIADPPWYRYVWHSNFDEYGRLGCMRRNVLMRWKSISVLFPNLPWPVWLVLLAGVAYIKIYMMWRQKSLGELWQGESSAEKQAKS